MLYPFLLFWEKIDADKHSPPPPIFNTGYWFTGPLEIGTSRIRFFPSFRNVRLFRKTENWELTTYHDRSTVYPYVIIYVNVYICVHIVVTGRPEFIAHYLSRLSYDGIDAFTNAATVPRLLGDREHCIPGSWVFRGRGIWCKVEMKRYTPGMVS